MIIHDKGSNRPTSRHHRPSYIFRGSSGLPNLQSLGGCLSDFHISFGTTTGGSTIFLYFLVAFQFFWGAPGTFAEDWPILRGLLPLYNNHRLTVCIPSCAVMIHCAPCGSHIESTENWETGSRSLRVIWAPCQVAVQHPRACTGLGVILQSWQLFVSFGALILSTVISEFFSVQAGLHGFGRQPARSAGSTGPDLTIKKPIASNSVQASNYLFQDVPRAEAVGCAVFCKIYSNQM